MTIKKNIVLNQLEPKFCHQLCCDGELHASIQQVGVPIFITGTFGSKPFITPKLVTNDHGDTTKLCKLNVTAKRYHFNSVVNASKLCIQTLQYQDNRGRDRKAVFDEDIITQVSLHSYYFVQEEDAGCKDFQEEEDLYQLRRKKRHDGNNKDDLLKDKDSLKGATVTALNGNPSLIQLRSAMTLKWQIELLELHLYIELHCKFPATVIKSYMKLEDAYCFLVFSAIVTLGRKMKVKLCCLVKMKLVTWMKADEFTSLSNLPAPLPITPLSNLPITMHIH
eukprot:jgi/Psemu1/17374/gm1.17374_g